MSIMRPQRRALNDAVHKLSITETVQENQSGTIEHIQSCLVLS